ncbi:APC family permease [Halomonas sp. G11]|jgi:amino acid transporter|uniref:APC family permease n=1 Tax=Halomonas sp. G11 TaxID=1684425 RepID=UPI00080245DD|nr:APC family permease [Halomonas sp. G11]OBA00830.1 amino acid permease [Halomonas sp. G11]
MTTSSSEQAKLVRVLARGDVLALAFGAMIGWGWIVLTGTAIQSAGSVGAILAFIIGGLAIVLVGLTYAELASAMPKVGGEHVYSYRALGHWPSFFCTWAIILGYLSVVAFEAVALPTVVEHLAPNYAVGHLWTIAGWEVKATWVAVGVGGSIAMMIINYFGVSTAALLQKVVTSVILLVGVMFVTGSLFEGNTANMMPLFSQSEGSVMAGVIAVIVMVPFLFVGFDVIPQAAEEINLPYKAIGKVLMVSVILAVVWYSLIILATSLALDSDAIAASSLSVPDAMERLFNASWAGNLMVMAGIAGIITSWNAFYIGGSRAIYALANAGMLPATFAKLHPRYKTPTNAIFLMGFLSCLAPLFGRPALVWIVNAGGLGIVLAYLFVAVSFMVLRVREPDMPRPFKVSNGKLCGTLAIILSFGMACLYLPGSPAALGVAEWTIFAVWVLLGIGLYMHALRTYGRDYSDRHMRADL